MLFFRCIHFLSGCIRCVLRHSASHRLNTNTQAHDVMHTWMAPSICARLRTAKCSTLAALLAATRFRAAISMKFRFKIYTIKIKPNRAWNRLVIAAFRRRLYSFGLLSRSLSGGLGECTARHCQTAARDTCAQSRCDMPNAHTHTPNTLAHRNPRSFGVVYIRGTTHV